MFAIVTGDNSNFYFVVGVGVATASLDCLLNKFSKTQTYTYEILWTICDGRFHYVNQLNENETEIGIVYQFSFRLCRRRDSWLDGETRKKKRERHTH